MKKIEVMDTTLRDGEQTPGVSFNSREKYEIARKLFEVGVDRIEVASAHAVEEDKRAVRVICKLAESIGKLESIEVLGFVDKGSVDWIYDAGCRTVNLLAKGSKKHCEVQLGKSLKEHLKDIGGVVEYAKSKGLKVNVYLEDWSNGMIESRDYVMGLIKELNQLDVKRIMLPDTLGILSPEKTSRFLKEIKEKFPNLHFDFHAHNDYGLATANTMAAISMGIDGIHVTANGLGERAGNCSLYEIAVCAKDHLAVDLGIKEKSFYELSRLIEGSANIRIQDNCPIVGVNVHQQTAGIHADGDKKGDLYKSPLKAERFGKRPQYALGKQSGKASILMNLKQLGISNPDEAIVAGLTARVRELGEQKETVTSEDLLALYWDEVGGPEKKRFEVLEIKPEIGLKGLKRCYVKARLNGQLCEASEKGDGGFDAFMNSLRKICKEIELPRLIDYDPKIPPGGGTDALVETAIEWQNKSKTFRTIATDTDQLISAVKAAEKMVNLVMMGFK